MNPKLGTLSNLGERILPRPEPLLRWAPLVATLFLILVIAHTLADLTWRIIPVPDEKGQTSTPSEPFVADRDQGRNGSQVTRLIELSVFGDPDPADEPDAIDLAEVEAPETQLNLQLRGVMATEIPQMAMAIIASGRGEDKIFRVGDRIGSGASLRAIYADRVILERGGDLETLRLPREDESDSGLTRTRSSNGRQASRQTDEQVTVPEELVDLRAAIQENPERITDVIRPTPHHVDGEMVGFRIFPGRMRDQFQALGLRAGDIVTAVNGQPMNSPAAAMSLMNELQDASSVDLTIERGGRQTSVTISMGN
ncbi:type II secretion system protein GspC [Natronospira bacteriovora]|uniref:Type II secretion system protein GspC n=1 Tax=Natronospira bacteriovora TaxID=3069753 RepID=A0ABU0W9J8_9GAMM|nr:type II secretion system protein GspC [Natronospira sp. AB-CW4]MDQ2070717.1 type II secretion system protein GspC [Natronospira sp. AB-CW4]